MLIYIKGDANLFVDGFQHHNPWEGVLELINQVFSLTLMDLDGYIV